MPAIGAVAGGDVLAERNVGVVLDRDLIVVVEHDQVAELLRAGQRTGLAGHAFLDVAIGGDDVDVVVEGAGARGGIGVEQPALVACRHGHADGRGQALAERTGRDLHALGVAELRVTRGLGLPGAQRLDVFQFQPETTEVQLDVQREAAVAARQHEPIAAEPVHVTRVVTHLTLKEGVRQRRQAHRRAGVAVADLLHRIGRQHAHGVDGKRIDIGPVVGVVGLGECGNFFHSGHELTPQVGQPVLLTLTVNRSAPQDPGPLAGCGGARGASECTLRCSVHRPAVYHPL